MFVLYDKVSTLEGNNYRTYLNMGNSRILSTTYFVQIVRITRITCAGITGIIGTYRIRTNVNFFPYFDRS